jgi:pilus assembly protein FimV
MMDKVPSSGLSEPHRDTLGEGVASVIAEVDTYLQYKQYGDAEKLLLSTLKQNSDSVLVKQKLAEVYALTGNRDAFEGVVSDFLQSASPDVDWTRLAELQRLLDTVPIVSEVTPPSADQMVDVEPFSMLESPSVGLDTLQQNTGQNTSKKQSFDHDLIQVPETLSASTLLSSKNEQDEKKETSGSNNVAEQHSKFDFSSIDLSLDSVKSTTSESKSFSPSAIVEEMERDPLVDSLSTKLELAKAYKDIGDIAGAKQLLQEVAASGRAEFVDRAKLDLKTLGVS